MGKLLDQAREASKNKKARLEELKGILSNKLLEGSSIVGYPLIDIVDNMVLDDLKKYFTDEGFIVSVKPAYMGLSVITILIPNE